VWPRREQQQQQTGQHKHLPAARCSQTGLPLSKWLAAKQLACMHKADRERESSTNRCWWRARKSAKINDYLPGSIVFVVVPLGSGRFWSAWCCSAQAEQAFFAPARWRPLWLARQLASDPIGAPRMRADPPPAGQDARMKRRAH